MLLLWPYDGLLWDYFTSLELYATRVTSTLHLVMLTKSWLMINASNSCLLYVSGKLEWIVSRLDWGYVYKSDLKACDDPKVTSFDCYPQHVHSWISLYSPQLDEVPLISLPTVSPFQKMSRFELQITFSTQPNSNINLLRFCDTGITWRLVEARTPSDWMKWLTFRRDESFESISPDPTSQDAGDIILVGLRVPLSMWSYQ